MSRPLRIGVLALLLAAFTVALLMAFARPPGGLGGENANAYEAPLDAFASPGGPVSVTGHAVRAERADAAGVTLLMHAFPPRPAADFRYLTFRLARIPRLSRPILVWNDGSATRLAALPDAPFAGGTVDLARLPHWQGEVTQVGIALMPTDLLSPSLLPDTTLELHLLRLEPPGWGAALRSLWTEWSAFRAWNGRSNHTLGFESGSRERSLQGFVASWLAGALVLLALSLGRATARRHALALVIAAGVALALLQLRHLALNASVATAAAQRATPAQPLSAAPAIAAAAVAFNARMRESDDRARVLVYGSGLFLAEYPTWLLRENNAATLRTPEALPPQEGLGDFMLVLVGDGDWRFDADAGVLTIGGERRLAWLWFESGPLRAYRFTTTGERG